MLTIEQLKGLKVGDWVWIVDPTDNNSGAYWIKYEYSLFNPMNEHFKDLVVDEDYGKTWIAYKNKELWEVNKDNIPLDVEVQALHMTCLFKETYIRQLQEELEEVRKSKKEAEGKSITLPYLLCTSSKFACVIWRDKDGKVHKTYTMPIDEAKGVLKEKEKLQNGNQA